MLLAKAFGDPHDGAAFALAGCVGDQLPEVAVVRRPELILYDHRIACAVLRQHVEPEVAGRGLRPAQLKLAQPERLGQKSQVLGQPGRKHLRLVTPHVGRLEGAQTAEAGRGHKSL